MKKGYVEVNLGGERYLMTRFMLETMQRTAKMWEEQAKLPFDEDDGIPTVVQIGTWEPGDFGKSKQKEKWRK